MANQDKIQDLVAIINTALKPLNRDFIFIGAAASIFYLPPQNNELGIRPTEDIDLIVEVYTTAEYSNLGNELKKIKFQPDTRKGAPICRWRFSGIIVDIMPINKDILGFSNRWYKEGIKNITTAVLNDGQKIKILTLPYYFATKLEAFKNRGSDPRFSSDLEDLVFLFDNVSEILKKLETPSSSLKKFLQTELSKWNEDRDLSEAVEGFMSGEAPERYQRLVELISQFSK